MAEGLSFSDTMAEYLKVFFALLILTAVTVGAARINFIFDGLGEAGKVIGVLIGLAIAAVKVALVMYIFMHLKFDHPYLRIFVFVPLFLLGIMLFALGVLEFNY